MALIDWPDRVISFSAQCIVCSRHVPISDMTVGLMVGDDKEAFACSFHLRRGEGVRFLRSWIEFDLELEEHQLLIIEGKGDGREAWLLSTSNGTKSLRG